VFKAFFASLESLMWVFKKQPWIMGLDVLLFELANEGDESYEKEQNEFMEKHGRPRYSFKYVYVTVRIYGIPWKNRSLDLLNNILKIAGAPSDSMSQKKTCFMHTQIICGG